MISRLFAPSHQQDRTIKFEEHFIDTADHIRVLPPVTVKEVIDVYADYPAELTDDCLKFDNVTQFVSHTKNGKTKGGSASKVVLFEGFAKGTSDNRLVKISSSVVNG